MDTPIIVVHDWNVKPPAPLKYINGSNELDFGKIYKALRLLPDHPGRGRIELVSTADGQKLRLKECDPKFLETFWDCAANLIDYFAEFAAYDSPIMQSVWFHLLDRLQDAGKLPHNFWQPDTPTCSHALEFLTHLDECLKLINDVIVPDLRPKGNFISTRPNLTANPGYSFGGFKAGLNPWQQFFNKNSPGFTVPVADRVYQQGVVQEEGTSQRHVPQGGLAIIQGHTERARAFAAKLARTEMSDRSEAEVLSEFNQHCLKTGETFGYTSLKGQDTLVQDMYPARRSEHTPRRYAGLGDPSGFVTKPSLNLLDEQVGLHKGTDAPAHPNGDADFRMWTVSSRLPQEDHAKKEIDHNKYSDMFDEYHTDDADGEGWVERALKASREAQHQLGRPRALDAEVP